MRWFQKQLAIKVSQGLIAKFKTISSFYMFDSQSRDFRIFNCRTHNPELAIMMKSPKNQTSSSNIYKSLYRIAKNQPSTQQHTLSSSASPKARISQPDSLIPPPVDPGFQRPYKNQQIFQDSLEVINTDSQTLPHSVDRSNREIKIPPFPTLANPIKYCVVDHLDSDDSKKCSRKKTAHFRSQSCPYSSTDTSRMMAQPKLQQPHLHIAESLSHDSTSLVSNFGEQAISDSHPGQTLKKPSLDFIHYGHRRPVVQKDSNFDHAASDAMSSFGRSFQTGNCLSQMKIPEVDSQSSSIKFQVSSNRGLEHTPSKPTFIKKKQGAKQTSGLMRRNSEVSRSSKSVVIHTGFIDNPILSSMLYKCEKREEPPLSSAKKPGIAKISRQALMTGQEWAQKRETKYLKMKLEQQIKKYELTEDLKKVQKESTDVRVKQSLLQSLLGKSETQNKYLNYDTNESYSTQN